MKINVLFMLKRLEKKSVKTIFYRVEGEETKSYLSGLLETF